MKPTALIKTSPSDFVVDEIPAYTPTGEGEHLFVEITKTGLNTLDAVRLIASALGVDGQQAGVAGMKDRHAVTTQWLSFPFPLGRDTEAALTLAIDGIEIRRAERHKNKLKTGHLRGNRFTLTLRDVTQVDTLIAGLERAGRRGVPNAYGAQRFGRDRDNAKQAAAWLRGERRAPRGRKEKRFLVSALQSHMFNEVLRERADSWDHILVGDLAQKHDSGGLFLADAAAHADAAARCAAGELAATGPMFGPKMRWPEGEPERIERAVLEREIGDLALLAPVAKLAQGARRSLRLEVTEMNVTRGVTPDVLTVSFVLPKGGYATTVLAHVCDTTTAGS